MIPESWLRTKVVPILKPRKDPELSDSSRPISLLNTLRTQTFGKDAVYPSVLLG
jgi:hypothetical protein